MKLDDLNCLLYNPAWTGKLLQFFLSGATTETSQKIKFELLFLALPLLYDDIILIKLASSNKRTTISTLFRDQTLKPRLIEISSKVISFKEATNKSIVCIGKNLQISEGGYAKITARLDYSRNEIPVDLKPYYKAAQNLGLILSKEDSTEIFLRLGI